MLHTHCTGAPPRKTTAEWGVAHGRGRSVAWQRHGSDVWAAVSDPRPDVPSILTYLRFFLPSPTVQAEVSRARGRCRSLRPGFGLKTSRQLGHLRRGRHRALGSVPSAAVA